ncbi:hypothetical protein G9P44_000273 [Scheffersomyces stipitis]|nr:hypothetical protein G9P44_000273 [Scheffersomyces stipitis]
MSDPKRQKLSNEAKTCIINSIHRYIKLNEEGDGSYKYLVSKHQMTLEILFTMDSYGVDYLETLKLKDKCDTKLRTLLNDSIERYIESKNPPEVKKTPTEYPTVVSETPSASTKVKERAPEEMAKVDSVSGTKRRRNSETHNEHHKLPDPRYIANRYHAEKYVRSRILTSPTKYSKIEAILKEHMKYQKTSEGERSKLIQDYQVQIGDLNKILNDGTTSKFQNEKHQMAQMKRTRLEKEMDEKLRKFDQRILFECKMLIIKSKDAFKELNVPFFNTSETYLYPRIDDDRAYIIQLMADEILRKKRVQGKDTRKDS